MIFKRTLVCLAAIALNADANRSTPFRREMDPEKSIVRGRALVALDIPNRARSEK